ncbi:unnamed protein product [Didymodactylos carnosus]|uniref:Insulin-degrading enzyme n=1 Tax=Didymodactylos carnosus TaxID=1234261 RepID=A0A815BQW7_9BILA|nr:unnamed protein product [Didymodactylos carnosus]CAF1276253.1 unnamed protein product [Didymodactylos carnosus]CAF3975618.1 unnamed protein product [Didymodactylos carnosus]CAF4067934.1 unnamed protein product [Didymodactylos carnosus]
MVSETVSISGAESKTTVDSTIFNDGAQRKRRRKTIITASLLVLAIIALLAIILPIAITVGRKSSVSIISGNSIVDAHSVTVNVSENGSVIDWRIDDSEFKKSRNDNRTFRGIQLSNGLTALLISDQTTPKAAAALSVHVGSWQDPLEAQGLAHFLEHMLFMGTTKYPDVNEYSDYIRQHGGVYNAFTADEQTVYFFDVNKNALSSTLGTESVDQLEELVINLFSRIRNVPQTDSNEFSFNGETPFPETPTNTYKPRRILIKPTKELHLMTIYWFLPSSFSEYESEPLEFVDYLLSYDCDGCLVRVLRERGWANAVKIERTQPQHVFSLFSIEMQLNVNSLSEVDEIADAIYTYIDLLKQNRSKWREFWLMMQQTSLLTFMFKEKTKSINEAAGLVFALQQKPMSHILKNPEQYVYDEAKFWTFLNACSPDNMQMHIVSTTLGNPSTQWHVEQWFGGRFINEPISLSIIQQWQSRKFDPSNNTYRLSFPDLNPYLKDVKEIINTNTIESTSNFTDYPVPIHNDQGLIVWQQYDTDFLLPKTVLFIRFLSNLVVDNLEFEAFIAVYSSLLVESMRTEKHYAELLSSTFVIYSNYNGMTLGTAENFQQEKETLIMLKRAPYLTLAAHATAQWQQINSENLDFNRIENEVAAIENLTIDSFQQFYLQFILSTTALDGITRSKLSIQLFPQNYSLANLPDSTGDARPTVVLMDDDVQAQKQNWTEWNVQ